MLKPSFLDPEEILKELELRKEMTAVDFGCGAGGWVIPLAKKLKKGKVYALDVQEEALSALEGQAKLEEVFNIETILCNLEKPEGLKMRNDSVDLILMTNLLFQIENKKEIFSQAGRILKKGGEVLVIDWKEESPFGPQGIRVLAEEVKGLAEDVGLKLKNEFDAGDYHYGLVFTKF